MNNRDYMLLAIEEAKIAAKEGEIPVGCVIVLNDQVIAKAHNCNRERDCNLYHAEIVAIEEASKQYGRWSLLDATLYVTMEPCLMCTGAIIQTRIKRLVYGVKEERFGACESMLNTFAMKSNHKVEVENGVCQEEIEELVKDFFKEMRQSKAN